MDGLAWVDELYAAFVGTLEPPLDDVARGLAHTLGLAPSREIGWAQVFGHEVTLAAPAMVAEAMPSLDSAAVRDAVMAHMLAVIDAFGTDRVEDGQVPPTRELLDVLERARAARDAAIGRAAPGTQDPAIDYALAEQRTLAAIAEERAVFQAGDAVGFGRYLAVSLDKQQLGLPASVALAHAAKWDARRRKSLARALESVALGLQLYDDVVDWGDDLTRGGAWAAALAAQVTTHQPARDRRTVPLSVKRLVQASGVLPRMLRASARSFRAARRRAEALGVERLAGWARLREAHIGELALREAESPGFTERARALSSWQKAVLA